MKEARVIETRQTSNDRRWSRITPSLSREEHLLKHSGQAPGQPRQRVYLRCHPRLRMNTPYVDASLVEGPVGLVLAESRGRTSAMAASFFSEVAHHPTSLWISIAQISYTHELVSESRRFSLIVLHRGQGDIARWCGAVSGRDVDKCARLALYRSRDGFLFLTDALASVACRVRSAHPLGDHTLFVADILSGEVETRRSGRRPLLTADLRP